MQDILETPSEVTSSGAQDAVQGGKFLTFLLGREDYGVEVLKIREIIGMMDITSMPQTPDFVQGVINLRGKVIPVIDLRTKFGLPRAEYNEQTCIVVVDVGMLVGVIVDTVQEVFDIPASDIEPPPRIAGDIDSTFILGMAKVKEGVKILLDIEKALTTDELVVTVGSDAN
jgi:purine-binding chemotaxis protein CheW